MKPVVERLVNNHRRVTSDVAARPALMAVFSRLRAAGLVAPSPRATTRTRRKPPRSRGATAMGRHRIVAPPGQRLDRASEIALEAGERHEVRFR